MSIKYHFIEKYGVQIKGKHQQLVFCLKSPRYEMERVMTAAGHNGRGFWAG